MYEKWVLKKNRIWKMSRTRLIDWRVLIDNGLWEIINCLDTTVYEYNSCIVKLSIGKKKIFSNTPNRILLWWHTRSEFNFCFSFIYYNIIVHSLVTQEAARYMHVFSIPVSNTLKDYIPKGSLLLDKSNLLK